MTSSVLAESHPVLAVRSAPWRSVAALVLPVVAIASVGFANGGFFPTSFGWTALAFAWVTVIALALAAPRWRLLEVLWLGAAGAVSLYTFVSVSWADSSDDAVNAGLRSLVYLAGVAGALVVLRRRDVCRWLGGLVIGVGCVCLYALSTRLLPTHFATFDSVDYRLLQPVGYWNALGIFAALSLPLALGVSGLGRGIGLRMLTASAAVVIAPTLYFTFSRGAWFALVVGAVAMFAFSPLRLRLVAAMVVLGPIPAVCVVLASRASALTNRYADLDDAARAGHKLGLALVVLVAAQILLTAVFVFLESRIALSQRGRLALGGAIAAAVLVGAAGVVLEYGSPVTIVRHGYDSFFSETDLTSNLNGRLFSLSNDGRTVLWQSAWNDFKAHPAVGSGAGSFARWWVIKRTSPASVDFAHNLYVQTLAELGIVGLLLLIALLGLPLVGAIRARRNPLVAPAVGGYVVFLVHAGVDWDWEMPAVTLVALFIGAALVAAARGRKVTPKPMSGPFRLALGTGACVVAAVAFVGLVGNIALARSNRALAAGDGPRAVTEAVKARTWAPWSTQALADRGKARILTGSRSAGLADLRRAAADDPNNWETWLDIAAATTGARHRAALVRAQALNPQGPEINDVLAATGGG